MHFSRPNNRPLEQGGHWERRVTVIGSTKTPKPLVIISSFLHQTQAYTDSRAAASCNTREENLANGSFSDEWGNFPIPSIWSHHASMVTQGVDFFFFIRAGKKPLVLWHVVCFQMEWFKKITLSYWRRMSWTKKFLFQNMADPVFICPQYIGQTLSASLP